MLTLRIEPCAMGNQMIRLMFAEYLRRRLPGATITGYRIPEFGLQSEGPVDMSRLLAVGIHQRIDVAKLLEECRERRYEGIFINCYTQRLEYFRESREYFATQIFKSDVDGHPTTGDELVIHIRAGDILHGAHSAYRPLPIAYYRMLVEQTGLAPVFVGQVGDDFYGRALRAAFPEARYPDGSQPLVDFQTLRNARNVVIAISTFSWLAAWLSTTPSKRIFMPVAGLTDPRHHPDIQLIPFGDSRYIFHRFPVMMYTGSDEQIRDILAL